MSYNKNSSFPNGRNYRQLHPAHSLLMISRCCHNLHCVTRKIHQASKILAFLPANDTAHLICTEDKIIYAVSGSLNE